MAHLTQERRPAMNVVAVVLAMTFLVVGLECGGLRVYARNVTSVQPGKIYDCPQCFGGTYDAGSKTMSLPPEKIGNLRSIFSVAVDKGITSCNRNNRAYYNDNGVRFLNFFSGYVLNTWGTRCICVLSSQRNMHASQYKYFPYSASMNAYAAYTNCDQAGDTSYHVYQYSTAYSINDIGWTRNASGEDVYAASVGGLQIEWKPLGLAESDGGKLPVIRRGQRVYGSNGATQSCFYEEGHSSDCFLGAGVPSPTRQDCADVDDSGKTCGPTWRKFASLEEMTAWREFCGKPVPVSLGRSVAAGGGFCQFGGKTYVCDSNGIPSGSAVTPTENVSYVMVGTSYLLYTGSRGTCANCDSGDDDSGRICGPKWKKFRSEWDLAEWAAQCRKSTSVSLGLGTFADGDGLCRSYGRHYVCNSAGGMKGGFISPSANISFLKAGEDYLLYTGDRAECPRDDSSCGSFDDSGRDCGPRWKKFATQDDMNAWASACFGITPSSAGTFATGKGICQSGSSYYACNASGGTIGSTPISLTVNKSFIKAGDDFLLYTGNPGQACPENPLCLRDDSGKDCGPMWVDFTTQAAVNQWASACGYGSSISCPFTSYSRTDIFCKYGGRHYTCTSAGATLKTPFDAVVGKTCLSTGTYQKYTFRVFTGDRAECPRDAMCDSINDSGRDCGPMWKTFASQDDMNAWASACFKTTPASAGTFTYGRTICQSGSSLYACNAEGAIIGASALSLTPNRSFIKAGDRFLLYTGNQADACQDGTTTCFRDDSGKDCGPMWVDFTTQAAVNQWASACGYGSSISCPFTSYSRTDIFCKYGGRHYTCTSAGATLKTPFDAVVGKTCLSTGTYQKYTFRVFTGDRAECPVCSSVDDSGRTCGPTWRVFDSQASMNLWASTCAGTTPVLHGSAPEGGGFCRIAGRTHACDANGRPVGTAISSPLPKSSYLTAGSRFLLLTGDRDECPPPVDCSAIDDSGKTCGPTWKTFDSLDSLNAWAAVCGGSTPSLAGTAPANGGFCQSGGIVQACDADGGPVSAALAVMAKATYIQAGSAFLLYTGARDECVPPADCNDDDDSGKTCGPKWLDFGSLDDMNAWLAICGNGEQPKKTGSYAAGYEYCGLSAVCSGDAEVATLVGLTARKSYIVSGTRHLLYTGSRRQCDVTPGTPDSPWQPDATEDAVGPNYSRHRSTGPQTDVNETIGDGRVAPANRTTNLYIKAIR